MSIINSERRAPLNYVEGADYEELVTAPNRQGVLQVTGGVDASGDARAFQMSGATGAGGLVIDDDAILAMIAATNALLAATLTVRTLVNSAGNVALQTDAVGTNWVAFAARASVRLILVNITGTTIEVRQGGAGVGLPIPDTAAFTFEGITNNNQLSIRRLDQSNTQVTASARWEA